MGDGNGARSSSDVLVPLVDVFILAFPWATTRNNKTQLNAAYRPSGRCSELNAGREYSARFASHVKTGRGKVAQVQRRHYARQEKWNRIELQSKTKRHPARQSDFVKHWQQRSCALKRPLTSGRDSIERE
jgi:hypothetical protein